MQMDDGHLEPVDKLLAGENPGLVFHVGEKLKIKDGDFRIKSIGAEAMVLEGLPGTRLKRSKQ